jgi:hypothetical protein
LKQQSLRIIILLSWRALHISRSLMYGTNRHNKTRAVAASTQDRYEIEYLLRFLNFTELPSASSPKILSRSRRHFFDLRAKRTCSPAQAFNQSLHGTRWSSITNTKTSGLCHTYCAPNQLKVATFVSGASAIMSPGIMIMKRVC